MLESRAKLGKPTPALDSRPDVEESLLPLWECYGRLSFGRSAGEPIRISDITALFDLLELNQDTRQYWFEVISRLDRKYLELYQEEQEQKRRNRESISPQPCSRNRRP